MTASARYRNMRHRGALLLLVLMLPALLAGCAEREANAAVSPNEPSSGGLVEEPKRWDGKVIEFRGEVVGDRMARGDGAWLHVNDDAYMYENVEEGAALGGYNSGMPIWFDNGSLTDEVGVFGDYKHEGDIVFVRGEFHAACAQHGGDMDIHATELQVVEQGHRAKDPVKPWKVVLGLMLTSLAGLLYLATTVVEHRESRGLYGRVKRRVREGERAPR